MREERSTTGRKTLGMSGRQLAHAEHDEPKIKSLQKNFEPWGDFDMQTHDFRDQGTPTQRYQETSHAESSTAGPGSFLEASSSQHATNKTFQKDRSSGTSSEEWSTPHARASSVAQPSDETSSTLQGQGSRRGQPSGGVQPPEFTSSGRSGGVQPPETTSTKRPCGVQPQGGTSRRHPGGVQPPGETSSLQSGGVQPPEVTSSRGSGGVQPPERTSNFRPGGVQPPDGTANLLPGGVQPPDGTANLLPGGVQPPDGTANLLPGGVQPPEETSNLQSGGVQPPEETSNLQSGRVQPPEETSSLQSGGVQPPDETSSSHHTQTTNTIQQQLPCHAVSTSVTRLVHHANRLEMLFSSQLYGPKSILRNSMGFSPQLKKDISLIHVSSHSRAPLANACFRGPVSARLTSCNAIAMHTPSPSRNGL